MAISDTSYMIDGFTIALLTTELGKSGQDSTLRNMLNTIRLCKPRFTKSHRSLDIDNEL